MKLQNDIDYPFPALNHQRNRIVCLINFAVKIDSKSPNAATANNIITKYIQFYPNECKLQYVYVWVGFNAHFLTVKYFIK